MKNNKMNIVERVKAPTPKQFKILRTVGIALASVGGAIIASPVVLPVGLVSAAGYLVLGGSIITVVSQTAVKTEEEPEPKVEQSKQYALNTIQSHKNSSDFRGYFHL